ncbi:hypothetical protein BZA77DRAFT_348863 [Pyronema omphalodes]|nr:hypothetical protein BZA77DRAFT_348863 [Pyronema omphalodes]
MLISNFILPAFIGLAPLAFSSPLRQISPGIAGSLSSLQSTAITNHNLQASKIRTPNNIVSPTGSPKPKNNPRTTLCTPAHKSLLETALQTAAHRAHLVSVSSIHGNPEIFQRYFKTTLPDERVFVAGRFHELAVALGAGGAGAVTYFCGGSVESEDFDDGMCREGKYIDFDINRGMVVRSCDGFFKLPLGNDVCHGMDRLSVILHELTHVLFNTKDYAKGYEDSVLLEEDKALDNADSYALYAQELFQKDCERRR